MVLTVDSLAAEPPPVFPYQDDPAVIEQLNSLRPGEAMFLPAPKAWGEGKDLGSHPKWPRTGPVHRDYSNRLIYVPDRRTAFYCGGGHAHRRYNDAWEYHLGGNTWVRLLPADGGDQGKIKSGWFVCQKLIRDPHAKLTAKEQEALENIRQWFKDHVTIKDGYIQTKTTGAGFMTSHNWEGVTYDPNVKQILHAAGHAKPDDWQCYFLLLGQHTPDNFHEELARFVQTLRPATSQMWVFDFHKNRWLPAYHDGEYVATRGGGSFMKYIPDLKRSIYYQAHGRDPKMMFYDGAVKRWSRVEPNGDASLRQLIHEDELAPRQEQQVAYSSRHRKLVAVIGRATHVYDIDANAWSRLPGDRSLEAHDARTIFAYDSNSDTFLLAKAGRAKGEGALFAMSLTDGKWREIQPKGPLPYARWSPGQGFYHPEHNVLVCHLPGRVWVYRHADSNASR